MTTTQATIARPSLLSNAPAGADRDRGDAGDLGDPGRAAFFLDAPAW
jgi:hypothetical protein